MVVHRSLSIDAVKPLNRSDFESIRPGIVGSVGDVLMTTRLRQSTPSMKMRWSPMGGKGREARFGANITDGMHRGYCDGGGLARVRDDAWESRRNFKTQRGWIYQDLRKPDTRIEPYLGSGPQYSWNNKLATVYKSLHTGDKFLPVPGEYALSPGELPRNGSTPGFYMAGDTVSVVSNRMYTANPTTQL
jgi:hypothetical protein